MAVASRTPWREWDGDHDGLIFVRDGTHSIDTSSLAQALRTDGVASNLGSAYLIAGTAAYTYTFYGFVEGERVPTLCDLFGFTDAGELVDQVIPCLLASIESE